MNHKAYKFGTPKSQNFRILYSNISQKTNPNTQLSQHTVPKIIWICISAQRNMSGFCAIIWYTLYIYIWLKPTIFCWILPWQARFLCGDSDYLWHRECLLDDHGGFETLTKIKVENFVTHSPDVTRYVS